MTSHIKSNTIIENNNDVILIWSRVSNKQFECKLSPLRTPSKARSDCKYYPFPLLKGLSPNTTIFHRHSLHVFHPSRLSGRWRMMSRSPQHIHPRSGVISRRAEREVINILSTTPVRNPFEKPVSLS